MDELKCCLQSEDSEHALLFFNAISKFVELEHLTFGTKIVGQRGYYRRCMIELSKSVLELPIKKVPLKLHCVIVHLDARY